MVEGHGVADKVSVLLRQRGWSYAVASRHAGGLDPTTIWKIATGKTPNPGRGTLQQLADAFGVSVDDLAGSRPLRRRRVVLDGEVARVPLMHLRVQADGDPIWDDTSDTIVVSRRLGAGRPNAFAAMVTGTCMAPHVLAGEVVLIDPDREPRHRNMVVVTTDDGETLVKWYRVGQDGRPYLRAADGSEIRPNGARIQGVVFRIERDAIDDPTP